MAHFLPPEHVRQVNKLEWPYTYMFVQPGTGRRPVDWCRNYVSVLYQSSIKSADREGKPINEKNRSPRSHRLMRTTCRGDGMRK